MARRSHCFPVRTVIFLLVVFFGISANAQTTEATSVAAAVLNGGANGFLSGSFAAGNSESTQKDQISQDGRYVVFSSRSKLLTADPPSTFTQIYRHDRLTGQTLLISRATGFDGVSGNGISQSPIISRDGTLVVFFSNANNLVPDDQNRTGDVFVRNVATGETWLANRASGLNGVAGNDGSYLPSLSADGRLLAFQTFASNIIPDSTATFSKIVVRNLQTQEIIQVDRVSGPNGAPANYPSFGAVITADGSGVLFITAADNITPGNPFFIPQLYLRRLATGETILVSRQDGASGAPANKGAQFATVSADGSVVSFLSEATNLAPDDTNNKKDVFVRNLSTNTTRLISRASGALGVLANGESFYSIISANGQAVVYTSRADNLVPGDTNTRDDVFVRNLSAETTVLVNRASGAGGSIGIFESALPDISPDGTQVTFTTSSPLAPDDFNNTGDVYLRNLTTSLTSVVSRATGLVGTVGRESSTIPFFSPDGNVIVFQTDANNVSNGAGTQVCTRTLATGETYLVSRRDAGYAGVRQTVGAESGVVSGNGRYVVFHSTSPDIIPGVNGGKRRFFRYDRQTGETVLVSRGDGPNGPPSNLDCIQVSVSYDGDVVAFVSPSTNLVPEVLAAINMVFVRTISTNRTILANRAAGANGTIGNGVAESPRLTADGQKIAFESASENLVPAILSGDRHIYVRDLVTEQIQLVSRASGPDGFYDRGGTQPIISEDGSQVLFVSISNTLVPGVSGGQLHLYSRNLTTNETQLVDRASGATGEVANNRIGENSYSLSANGRYAAFLSPASNLVNGASGGAFIRDLTTGELKLISRGNGPNGVPMVGPPRNIRIDATGTLAVFSGGLAEFFNDGVNYETVFLRNIPANTTTRLSRQSGPDGPIANENARSPVITHDGNAVIFTSEATNLAPDATVFRPNFYVRYLDSGITLLVNRADGPTGAVSDAEPDTPSLSWDGSVISFRSEAENLVRGDSNRATDMFVRTQATNCTYQAQPSSTDFGPLGGTGTVTVTAPSDCPWSALSTVPWITVTGSPNSVGTGMLQFQVARNDGLPRTGLLTVATQTFVINQQLGGFTTVGAYRPTNGFVYLRNSNTGGFADVEFFYGTAEDIPIVGDWNGDGRDTIGIYRGGIFYLRNENTTGFADIVFSFGQAGDIPIAGDWDGDGIDTVGIVRNGQFFLRNQNSEGPADTVFAYGFATDIPIAGDWNGDGIDTIGAYRGTNGFVYLRNANSTGFADIEFFYGSAQDRPVAGDWNGDGIDTIGIRRGNQFYLRNSNTTGFADLEFPFGTPGDIPIVGNWDGIP